MSLYPKNIYLHGLRLFTPFGPRRIIKLLNYFTNVEQAFLGTTTDYAMAGLEPELINKFIKFRASIDLKLEQDRLERENIYLLSQFDANYPVLLKQITDFPPLLYYRGYMSAPDELCLAVVGTRKITAYGRNVIPHIVAPLIDAGITIVSGLAYGIDAAVHRLVLEKRGRTIALLGCGIDTNTIYPKNHVLLAEEIIACGGAIVSEYPPHTPAFKQNFIARNRIISGLSLGTLLIECNLKSGTLITAKHALDQNRTIYAIPGPIYAESSQGPNNLIKLGARLVTSSEDILNDLNLQVPHITNIHVKLDTKEEEIIYTLLGQQPIEANELISQSGLEAHQVITTLTFLEIKGRIRNIGGGQYTRT